MTSWIILIKGKLTVQVTSKVCTPPSASQQTMNIAPGEIKIIIQKLQTTHLKIQKGPNKVRVGGIL
jgi:hypothetical protein